MRISILIAFILSTLSIGYAFAQFNGCGLGFCPNGCTSGFCPAGSTGSGAPLTPCNSTGIYNLGNVCNDIYFIGALK